MTGWCVWVIMLGTGEAVSAYQGGWGELRKASGSRRGWMRGCFRHGPTLHEKKGLASTPGQEDFL